MFKRTAWAWRVALLVSSVVLCVAAGLLAQMAEMAAIRFKIEAENTWVWFQATSIRTSIMLSDVEVLEHSLASTSDPSLQAKIRKKIDDLHEKAQRYHSNSDLETPGSRELSTRAKHAEQMRDIGLERFRQYFSALGILALGLLFAFATVVTGIKIFAWTGSALNILGVLFLLIGAFDPTIIAAPAWLLLGWP